MLKDTSGSRATVPSTRERSFSLTHMQNLEIKDDEILTPNRSGSFNDLHTEFTFSLISEEPRPDALNTTDELVEKEVHRDYKYNLLERLRAKNNMRHSKFRN
uniref:Uncharacterized protein n=1 Tax=Panagrolaimus sp. PS1159 TaxID=55785 RepID=A0AC35FS80_9BILA